MDPMISTPLITIAISAYNVEKYIEKCLLSALNQDYPNLEILVIDNVSTDSTLNIVTSVIQTHKRKDCVRIIKHEENKQLSGSRNSGLEHAKGEYLMFLDADDSIEQSTVSTLFELSKKNQTDISFASFRTINEDGVVMVNEKYKNAVYKGKDLFSHFVNKNISRYPIMVWNKLYRTDFLRDNDIKCIPNCSIDDVWFSFQTLFYAKKIVSTDFVGYNYLIRKGSIIHQTITDNMCMSYQLTFEHINDLISSNFKKKPLNARLFEFIFGYLSHFVERLCVSNHPYIYKKNALKRLRGNISSYYKYKKQLKYHWYRTLLTLLQYRLWIPIVEIYKFNKFIHPERN